MARPENPATARPPAARNAAHSAPAPAPVPATGPAPDSPAAAVRAALAAHPGGATTAAIASAAGTGRPAARDMLTAMETDGTVTRTRGGRPGIPDTWTLTTAAPPAAGPGHDGEHPAQPDSAPADGGQDGSGQGEAASGTSRDDAPASPEGAPDPAAGQPAQLGDSRAVDDQDGPDQQEPAAARGRRDDAAQGSASNPDDGASDSTAAGGQPASAAPDPALVTEITGRVGQIQAAATAAAAVLAVGDLRAVLAGLDEICEQATGARRALKAAAGGKKAPAARPGALRDKIRAHLRAHPGTGFTPHDIHKVLGNSSGAIANALDTLVKHGQAELASDKPRKFRLTPATPAELATGCRVRVPVNNSAPNEH